MNAKYSLIGGRERDITICIHSEIANHYYWICMSGEDKIEDCDQIPEEGIVPSIKC